MAAVEGLFLTWNVNDSNPEDEHVKEQLKKVLTRCMAMAKDPENVGIVALGVQESGGTGWAKILVDFFGQDCDVQECESGSFARVGLAVIVLPKFKEIVKFSGRSSVLFHSKETWSDLFFWTKVRKRSYVD